MNSRLITSLVLWIALLVGLGCASDAQSEKTPCLRYLGCYTEEECQEKASQICEAARGTASNPADFDWDRCYSPALAACLERGSKYR